MGTITTEDFEILFREIYSRCYFYAVRLVNDEDASRDIISESFVSVWENRATIDPQKLRGYVFSCIRNKCINHLRETRRFEQVENEAMLPEAFQEEEWAQREARLTEVERELERLPERTRYVLEQCYYHKRTYCDVGDELGMSVNGVKKHIVKGMAALCSHFNTDKHKRST